MNKIFEIKNLKKILKNNKKKIVLCHGVFDVLHHGHIKYFEDAKKNAGEGGVLIVSITDDKFVNKGFGRPYFNFKIRAETIASLSVVDYVCKSPNESSVEVIKYLKPYIYCKGHDYGDKKKDLTKNIYLEKKAVERYGGSLVITQTPMQSSSKIINSYYSLFSKDQEKNISNIKKNFESAEIIKSIKDLKSKKILVIGEIIIDEYVFCETLGKSGKEPFLVVNKKKTENYLGGSAAIAMNLSDFCKKIDLVSYIGSKNSKIKFIKKNLNKNIKSFLIKKNNSTTVIKRRYIEFNERNKMLGVYSLNDSYLNKFEESKIVNYLKSKLKLYDLVIVADYGHGLITKKIASLITKNAKYISLNAQINSANTGYHSLDKYRSLNIVVINLNELKHETRNRSDNFYIPGKKLMTKMNINNLIVTRGRDGATFFSKDKKIFEVASYAKEVVDKIGAGDCLFAFVSLFLAAKFDKHLSLFLASLAAGKNVEMMGNSNYIKSIDLFKTINYCLK
jgi:rfaE bifunctional protein kinase chain/domain/rfaE bifunctional protein nucleotidyltransferase chain/domain